MSAHKEAEIERTVRNVAAILSFEDIELTEQNKKDIRRVLRGEISGDDMIAEIEARHGIKRQDVHVLPADS